MANIVPTQSELPIEQVQAIYFDPLALREPSYKLYRINTPKGRYYYTLDEFGIPKLYIGMTTMLAYVIPKPSGLLRWMSDMGYEKSQRYMREKAFYGTLMHTETANFCLKKFYDLDTVDKVVSDYIFKNQLVLEFSTKEQWIEDLKKDIAGWIQFCYEYNFRPIAIEVMLVHPDGYSGTLDYFGYMDIQVSGFWGEVYKTGERKDQPKETKKTVTVKAIIDLKSTRKGTGDEEKDVQLEGYKKLFEHNFPEHIVERLYNWSPKDWRSKPTFTLNDKTDSVDLEKFDAWVRVAQVELMKKDPVFARITGKYRMGEEPANCYAEMSILEYIKQRDHSTIKSVEQPIEDLPL